MDVTEVVRAGEQLSVVKLLMTSIQCLWIYDYFLTLEDEVNYAWSGKRSWMFALFIAIRYTPVFHLVWVHTTMFHYIKPFCEHTKWVPVLHSAVVTFLAQTAIGLRVYAMTGWNKFIGGALALPIAVQICNGIFAVVWIGLHPLESFPEINLDAFNFCAYKRWKLGEAIYYNLTIFFDLLAFLIILVRARISRAHRYPGMPSVLDTIVRHSTPYFLLIFFVQVLAELFIFLAPEGIQLLPGTANTILVPVMASRLMLSLKKATSQPKKPWSLETMTTMNQGMSMDDETNYFPPRMSNGLHEISRTPAIPNQDDVELDAVLRLSRDRGSYHRY